MLNDNFVPTGNSRRELRKRSECHVGCGLLGVSYILVPHSLIFKAGYMQADYEAAEVAGCLDATVCMRAHTCTENRMLRQLLQTL